MQHGAEIRRRRQANPRAANVQIAGIVEATVQQRRPVLGHGRKRQRSESRQPKIERAFRTSEVGFEAVIIIGHILVVEFEPAQVDGCSIFQKYCFCPAGNKFAAAARWRS